MTMSDRDFDPLAQKARADLTIERAADGLRRIVQELVVRLDPFPAFPGAFFTYGIEIEPEAAARVDRGCIVLTPEGEFRELEIGVDMDGLDMAGYADPVAMRKEELKKIELHPRDYVVYAYSAITILTELLLERMEAEEPAGGPDGRNG